MSFKAFVISLSVAILAVLPWRAVAVQSVNLEWVASSSPEVTGYTVRYGLASGNYTLKTSAGMNTNAAISGLLEGQTYYFVVTDHNAAGIESAPSNEAVYTVPGIMPPSNVTLQNDPEEGIVLRWDASSNPNVEGYAIYFGTASGDETTIIAAGDFKEFVLYDWMWEMPSYFVVTAYTYDSQESAASAAVSMADLQATPDVTVVPAPVLSLQHIPATGLNGVYSITASGVVPASWVVEASSDLQTWKTLATGSDPGVNVTVAVSPKPKLFFRLASSTPDVQMVTQKPVGAFPKSFTISTADTAPPDWSIQFSQDLQTWNPLASGTGTPVNVAVVTADVPVLYFRLKGL